MKPIQIFSKYTWKKWGYIYTKDGIPKLSKIIWSLAFYLFALKWKKDTKNGRKRVRKQQGSKETKKETISSGIVWAVLLGIMMMLFVFFLYLSWYF
jgi:hypothetical protein